jgi:hypothetical protein
MGLGAFENPILALRGPGTHRPIPKLPAASTRLWPTCDGRSPELLAPERSERKRS